jgi:hypothetical protein
MDRTHPTQGRPAAPPQCPSCLGTESPVTYTLVLGFECSACRLARLNSRGNGQAAVEARRAANVAKGGK